MTGVAGLTWWLLHKGTGGAGIANVLALPAVLLRTITAVVGLRSRPHVGDLPVLAAQARLVLDRIAAAEAVSLQRLLADTGDPHPADTAFVQSAVVRWRTDGGGESGSLSTIAPSTATCGVPARGARRGRRG